MKKITYISLLVIAFVVSCYLYILVTGSKSPIDITLSIIIMVIFPVFSFVIYLVAGIGDGYEPFEIKKSEIACLLLIFLSPVIVNMLSNISDSIGLMSLSDRLSALRFWSMPILIFFYVLKEYTINFLERHSQEEVMIEKF